MPPVDAILTQFQPRATAVAETLQLADYDAALPRIERFERTARRERVCRTRLDARKGSRWSASRVSEALGVVPAQRRLIGRLLEILAEDGLLRKDGDQWVAIEPPVHQHLDDELASLIASYGTPLHAELSLLAACGPYLGGVLSGRLDPLALLFPKGSAELAENLYQVAPAGRAFNQLIGEIVAELVRGLPATARLRILEIGGGTGATSSFVLPALPPDRSEYLFTDISPAFTGRAAQKFAQYPFVTYQTFDVERSPSSQGLVGRTFDLVIAANVLHATRDLGETFAHVRELLAPRGLLIMPEMMMRQRWIDLTFGLTDGWWRFVDHDRRPDYPLLSRAGWRTFLAEHGFSQAATLPAETAEGVYAIQSILLAKGQDAAHGRFLVLGDRGGAWREVVERLERTGAACDVVQRDSTPAESIAAGHSHRVGGHVPCRGVLHLWGLDHASDGAASADAVEAATRDLCQSLLVSAQTLTDGRIAGSR